MLTPKDYIGSLMELAQERRGQFKELKFIAENRASIVYELPLAEVISLVLFNGPKSSCFCLTSFSFKYLNCF